VFPSTGTDEENAEFLIDRFEAGVSFEATEHDELKEGAHLGFEYASKVCTSSRSHLESVWSLELLKW
jgi:hypothetical protein